MSKTMLSPMRSGNISIRASKNGEKGFLITPSGKKYESLKPNQIVFVTNKGKFNKTYFKPSSEYL